MLHLLLALKLLSVFLFFLNSEAQVSSDAPMYQYPRDLEGCGQFIVCFPGMFLGSHFRMAFYRIALSLLFFPPVCKQTTK